MAKYKRPLTDILDNVISDITRTLQVTSVILNSDGSQTLFCCNIFYAQKFFDLQINGLSYKIIDFSYNPESITVKANFIGSDPTILPGTIFDLYRIYFYYGTPITTAVELQQIKNANLKTPMFWLWEQYKEKFFKDEMIERTAAIELYALTQPPEKLMQMVRVNIQSECVDPMRRMGDCLIEEITNRSDLFEADEQEYDTEEFPRFGIIARNQGATKKVFMDDLSGIGIYLTLNLFYQDECACPVPIPLPVPDVRTISTGSNRTLSNGNTRTLN